MQARLRCRRLDPALADLESVRALEQRERRAALMRQRPRAGLAENAQAVVAGAVLDLKGDVDSPLARVERDLDADPAIHEIGRAREAIVAQPRRGTQDELDRRSRPVAGRGRGARTGHAFRSDSRPGVGIGVFVAAVALGDEPVLAPAPLSGALVDDVEASVGLDLHAHEAVLDRRLTVRLDSGLALRGRRRRESEPAG